MKHVALNSSVIRSVGYFEDTCTLGVCFTNGSKYQYSGVPMAMFVELINAESAGEYFDKNIKDFYEHEREV